MAPKYCLGGSVHWYRFIHEVLCLALAFEGWLSYSKSLDIVWVAAVFVRQRITQLETTEYATVWCIFRSCNVPNENETRWNNIVYIVFLLWVSREQRAISDGMLMCCCSNCLPATSISCNAPSLSAAHMHRINRGIYRPTADLIMLRSHCARHMVTVTSKLS